MHSQECHYRYPLGAVYAVVSGTFVRRHCGSFQSSRIYHQRMESWVVGCSRVHPHVLNRMAITEEIASVATSARVRPAPSLVVMYFLIPGVRVLSTSPVQTDVSDIV
jgi:hypothetical protein